MFGRWRHWAGAGVALASLAFGVSATPGYLPAVGPVPLRFRPAAQSVTNLVRMPLPPPDLPPPEPSTPSTPAIPSTAPAPSKQPPSVLPAASLPPTNAPVEPNAVPSGSEPMISPQMLLRYFNRSTNGVGAGVIAPLQFAPPASTTPPSSTATYSTDPK